MSDEVTTTHSTGRRTRPRGSERPIGHAILALFIALLVGLVLDARGLKATAEQLQYGSTQRTVALAVVRPVADVTNALYLNEPRSAVLSLLGRTSQGGSVSAFNVTSNTTPPPTSHSTTPANTGGGNTGGGSTGGNTNPNTGSTNPSSNGNTGLPQPTKAQPLRILVLGDSLAGDFGQPLYSAAQKTGVMKAAGPVDYHISTGLTRPDDFDWPGELQSALSKYHPTTVVLALGLNDTQPMTLADGSFLGTGTAGWQKEYRRRVNAMMTLVTNSGAKIVYVAPPPTTDTGNNPYLFSINNQIVKAAKAHPGAASVFTYPRFSSHLQYTQSIPINGTETVVRTGDGIHVNSAGSNVIVGMVMDALGTLYKLPKTSG